MIARPRELPAFGFEPRHLRAFKTAADREVGLVEQVVRRTSAVATPPPRPAPRTTVTEIAALSVRLHATLVKSGLRPALTRPGSAPGSDRG